jgi:8-oxo-dGTP diphosphatase
VDLVAVAACALVDPDGQVLIAQRPEGKPMAGLWELPGGKIEAGETPEQAVIREMAEELGIRIEQACLSPLTFASHAYESFHLLMPVFVCRRWHGNPRPSEHAAIDWVKPQRMKDYPMPPADDPVVARLCDWL